MAVQRHVAVPLLLALLVLAVFAMAPQPASADTAVTLDGTWYDAVVDGPEMPFTFTAAVDVEITVADIYCFGDIYEVFDFGTSIGFTSPVADDDSCDLETPDPDAAIALGFSSGVFPVGPGSHSISIFPIQAPFGFDDWRGMVKFEAAVQGPEWEVRAKIGGGNIYNAFLPDYEPGTWATKNVGIYLFCVPGDAPIDLLRADRSVIFKDGTHTYSTKPTDVCIDENGLAAPPIVDWGPIMVDTKAPVCRITPSTTYVNRSTTATVTLALDFSDTGSGLDEVTGTGSQSGGANVIDSDVTIGPPSSIVLEVAMGSSTAGRVEVIFEVVDIAGNSSSCKGLVRAR